MKVEIWSDVVCPWCYIGKRRFEKAIEAFGEPVEVVWRSFELDPSSRGDRGTPVNEAIARKYRMSVAQADAMIENVRRQAADEGLEFDLHGAGAANTFLAHQLIHFAQLSGHGDEMKERLLRAHFTQGLDIEDARQLVDLAAELGLDAAAAREALDRGAHATAVRADELEARQLQVTGVPFFLFERQYAVPGAQTPETFLQVLNIVKSKLTPVPVDGEVCDVDVC